MPRIDAANQLGSAVTIVEEESRLLAPSASAECLSIDMLTSTGRESRVDRALGRSPGARRDNMLGSGN